MSVYCISDMHGRKDLFDEMMEKIKFSRFDHLYVLGDSIDRGGGLELFNYLLSQKNIHVLAGNHELGLLKMLNVVSNDCNRRCAIDKLRRWSDGLSIKRKLDGIGKYLMMFKNAENLPSEADFLNMRGFLTLCEMVDMPHTIDSLNEMTSGDILRLKKAIKKLPTVEELTVNDRHFIMVHGGYNYNKRNDPLFVTNVRDDFFQNPVNFGFGKKGIVVFGHTTTRDIRIVADKIVEVPYKIWHGEDKIGIDCAAAYPQGRLACLRLNDLEEFYVDNHQSGIVTVDYYNQKVKSIYDYEERIIKKYPNSYQSDFVNAAMENDYWGTLFRHTEIKEGAKNE